MQINKKINVNYLSYLSLTKSVHGQLEAFVAEALIASSNLSKLFLISLIYFNIIYINEILYINIIYLSKSIFILDLFLYFYINLTKSNMTVIILLLF